MCIVSRVKNAPDIAATYLKYIHRVTWNSPRIVFLVGIAHDRGVEEEGIRRQNLSVRDFLADSWEPSKSLNQCLVSLQNLVHGGGFTLLQKFKHQKFSKQEVSRRLSFELQTFLLGEADRLQCGFSDGHSWKMSDSINSFFSVLGYEFYLIGN